LSVSYGLSGRDSGLRHTTVAIVDAFAENDPKDVLFPNVAKCPPVTVHLAAPNAHHHVARRKSAVFGVFDEVDVLPLLASTMYLIANLRNDNPVVG
jgi:hypothetical protein